MPLEKQKATTTTPLEVEEKQTKQLPRHQTEWKSDQSEGESERAQF